ncbi:MAG: tetratricopeptide repeat protein, partial [Deltaproteobacteria bacterium]|nr:tetratricopeptide repeat protein [Deltaproteobacteria bacterium]
HGPAGVGKSCLAGKLIERFQNMELIVIHGRLTVVDLLSKLMEMFDRTGNTTGLEVLKFDLDPADKIKAFFRSAFENQGVMFYFDDFEQNLDPYGHKYQVAPNVLPIFRPILEALDWSKGQAKLILTSRYPFVLEYKGKDLSSRLAPIPLMSFRGADLDKKIAELPHIRDSKHRKFYLEVGGHNPRLLEWLELIAQDEAKYDLTALTQAVQGKTDEFVQEYLISSLIAQAGTEFQRFLPQAAVYRIPVPLDAFKAVVPPDLSDTPDRLLDRGVTLTLIEQEHPRGQSPVYWVNPVIREQQRSTLPPADQKPLHDQALLWYHGRLTAPAVKKKTDYSYMAEAVHHALESDDIRVACAYAIPLGDYYSRLLLYRDQSELLGQVTARITAAVIAEAVEDRDSDISMIFSALGIVWRVLGDARLAVEYYQKALEIDRKVFGDGYPEVANNYNNLGLAWQELGDAGRSVAYLEKARDIYLNVFGESHQSVATVYANLGAAWRALGDTRQAMEYLQKSLDIYLKVFGDSHQSVANGYNNLGAAWIDLGDARQAVGYYEKALEVNLKVFGESHPSIATGYNNLGGAWNALGDARRALGYYQKALEIDLNAFGDGHPKVAIRYNNLGSAWSDLGDLTRAIDYLERAYNILITVYDADHPYLSEARTNLEKVRSKARKGKLRVCK